VFEIIGPTQIVLVAAEDIVIFQEQMLVKFLLFRGNRDVKFLQELFSQQFVQR
jgi:hypothetical protein